MAKYVVVRQFSKHNYATTSTMRISSLNLVQAPLLVRYTYLVQSFA